MGEKTSKEQPNLVHDLANRSVAAPPLACGLHRWRGCDWRPSDETGIRPVDRSRLAALRLGGLAATGVDDATRPLSPSSDPTRPPALPNSSRPSSPELRFPASVCVGRGNGAAQIEGPPEDGKGESTWDRFARVRKIDTPTVACDHYHRYREDVALLGRLGIPNYRLSVAWPRIFPEGDGAPNPKGLDFDDRLVDALLENGVTPWITLYHWDLPQALEDRGGWRVRATPRAFGRYAQLVVQRLGDRVKNWMSMNEILRFVPCGYQYGCDAPGAKESAAVINQIYHHALLAHGYAVEAVRELGGKRSRVGLVHNPPVPVPVTETATDITAARADYLRETEQLMGPLYGGSYTAAFLKRTGADAPKVELGDLELISQKTDFLGLNVDCGEFVRRGIQRRGGTDRIPAFAVSQGGHFVAEHRAPSHVLGDSSRPRSLWRGNERHHREWRAVRRPGFAKRRSPRPGSARVSTNSLDLAASCDPGGV